MVIKEIYVSRRCQPPKKTQKQTNKQNKTKQNKIKQKIKTKQKSKQKQNKTKNKTEQKQKEQHNKRTHQNRLKYSECGHQVSRGYWSIFISLCRDGDRHEADQVKSIAAFSACTKLMENVSYIPDTSLILLYISDLITRVTFSDSKKEVSHVALYYYRTYKRIVWKQSAIVSPQIAKFMGQHGTHLGPVGPRWAPCWPHEPCYEGPDASTRLEKIFCTKMYFVCRTLLLQCSCIEWRLPQSLDILALLSMTLEQEAGVRKVLLLKLASWSRSG